MKKTDELRCETGCLNSALPNEYLFVLLARDEAAPVAIEAWVHERIRLGKNKLEDPMIKEAIRCANAMRETRGEIRRALGKPDAV